MTQRQKRDNLAEKLEELLNEDEAMLDSFEIDIVYLAKIEYQNVMKDDSYDIVWYFTKGIARKLTEYEVSFWPTEYVVDLDDYEMNGFVRNNRQLMKVVDSCKSFVSR